MLYTYACLICPTGPKEALPERGLLSTVCQHTTTPTGQFAWGNATYDRELTDEEVQYYGLELISRDTRCALDP